MNSEQKEYYPFIARRDLTFIAFQLSEILKYGLGFDSRELKYISEKVDGITIPEGSDDPFVLEKDGTIKYYQRPLVWELEDKQLLIDAIYNETDIGKFVVVRREYNYIKAMIKKGHTKGLGFQELVDGKQRLNAIAEFMQDGFKDSNGRFYSELSDIAKRHFRSYNKCTIALMEGEVTPNDIKNAFLNVNHTGKPMTKEHIEFIKSLNV